MNNQSKKPFEFNPIYLFVIIGISIFYFSLTYLGSSTNISIMDIILLTILICFVSLLEYLIIKYKFFIILSKKFTFSLMIVFNVYTVNLVYNQYFLIQPYYIELSLMGLAIFIAYTLLSILNSYKKFQNIFVIGLLILSIGIFFTPLYYHLISNDDLSDLSDFKIMQITFKTKPNIYIIGVDALAPKSLLKKHLKTNSTDLHKLLDQKFISYRNMFSGGDRTIGSYISMLSLTPDYWEQYEANDDCRFCPTKMNRTNLFNGLSPSPLLQIFKSNGYETTTAHEWPHLGQNKGPYLDNYLLRTGKDGKRVTHSVCDLTSPRSSLLGFFGYCKIRSKLTFFKKLNSSSLHYKGFSYNLAWDLRNIESIANKEKVVPQIYIGHILSPRHTAYDFDIRSESGFKEFRDYYIKAANVTGALLRLAIEYISKNDPNGIVFVWGDHGPILSQHLSWDKRFDPSSSHNLVKSPVFFAQDRFGIYGGIFNGGACVETSFLTKRLYSTPQHVLRDILHCLADEKSRQKNIQYFSNFKKEESFPMPRRGESKTNPKDKIVYKNFLYE